MAIILGEDEHKKIVSTLGAGTQSSELSGAVRELEELNKFLDKVNSLINNPLIAGFIKPKNPEYNTVIPVTANPQLVPPPQPQPQPAPQPQEPQPQENKKESGINKQKAEKVLGIILSTLEQIEKEKGDIKISELREMINKEKDTLINMMGVFL